MNANLNLPVRVEQLRIRVLHRKCLPRAEHLPPLAQLRLQLRAIFTLNFHGLVQKDHTMHIFRRRRVLLLIPLLRLVELVLSCLHFGRISLGGIDLTESGLGARTFEFLEVWLELSHFQLRMVNGQFLI